MFFIFEPMPGGVASRREDWGLTLGLSPLLHDLVVPDSRLAVSVAKVARAGLTGLNVYVSFTTWWADLELQKFALLGEMRFSPLRWRK